MSLGDLLVRLRPLMDDVERNWDEITELLNKSRKLAEYEVARHFVAKMLDERIATNWKSPDPKRRVQALEAMRLVYPRKKVANLVRHSVKDADPRVRSKALRTARTIGITDVALPDFRYKPPAYVSPKALGQWNATGWNFGLFPNNLRERQFYFRGQRIAKRKPKKGMGPKTVGLPKLETRADVIAWLGLGDEATVRKLMRHGTGPGSGYVSFTIKKRSGADRSICAPRAQLRAVQRTILSQLLDKIQVHECCHGFVRGRSIVSNAQRHLQAKLLLKIDLKDFFPTIHYRRIVGMFRYYGYNYEVSATLAGLVTFRDKLESGESLWPGVLPQGAPTSPAIANILCRRLDARLEKFADKIGATYTRYADDLTFSFAELPEKLNVGRVFWWIDQVCQQEGFNENYAKRRVLRPHQQQRVTGIVVNDTAHIPRAARRRFRAILANCKHHGVEYEAKGDTHFEDKLRGFAAYVHMVQPELGQLYNQQIDALFPG
jgi:RNA-directed DNA polymerase